MLLGGELIDRLVMRLFLITLHIDGSFILKVWDSCHGSCLLLTGS